MARIAEQADKLGIDKEVVRQQVKMVQLELLGEDDLAAPRLKLLLAALPAFLAGMCFAFWLRRRYWPLTRRRISTLTSASQKAFEKKEYEAALSCAKAAAQLASALGHSSMRYGTALFHLAAVHSAMANHADAKACLLECDRITCATHGERSLKRVAILKAIAEACIATSSNAADREQAALALRTCQELEGAGAARGMT